ncbi:MAG: glycosyltransferase family 4 protein, partial [Pseudomonadota bacterium]
ALARANTPILVTAHGADVFGLRGRVFDWLRTWVIKRCQQVTVVSRFLETTLREGGKFDTPMAVLSMGVDLKTQFVADEITKVHGPLKIVFVGRLVEKKGVSYLIDAMAEVEVRDSHTNLTIVGDGQFRQRLENQARELGLDSKIDFVGAVAHAQVPQYLRDADIIVVPSIVAKSGDQEGLGLVTIEGMGAGCAAIASDLPAIRDVITDGENGLLIPPNDPRALAVALHSLDQDRDELTRLKRNGATSVTARFDWSSVSKRYVETINLLTN